MITLYGVKIYRLEGNYWGINVHGSTWIEFPTLLGAVNWAFQESKGAS